MPPVPHWTQEKQLCGNGKWLLKPGNLSKKQNQRGDFRAKLSLPKGMWIRTISHRPQPTTRAEMEHGRDSPGSLLPFVLLLSMIPRELKETDSPFPETISFPDPQSSHPQELLPSMKVGLLSEAQPRASPLTGGMGRCLLLRAASLQA